VLDHRVVLLADQVPVDRTGRGGLQAGELIGLAGLDTVELLLVDRHEARQELEAQQPAEGKGHLALTVAVHVLPVHSLLGAVTQHPLEHRGHFGGGARLELGVDAARLALDVPVDHHAPAAVADVPLGHAVLVPGAELLRVGGAGGRALAPDLWPSDLEDRVTT
jgi:hypothetical protein